MALVGALIGSSGCQTLQNSMQRYAPDVNLKDIQLADIGLSGAKVNFMYEMKNKTNVGLTFSRLLYNIKVDGKQFFNADNEKNVKLAPNGTSEFTIGHQIEYVEFAESLIDFFKKDKLNIDMDGKVGVLVSQQLGSVEVPINASKVINVPKLPDINFKDFKFKSTNVNFSNPLSALNPEATFELSFGVKNPNSFNIDLSSVQYNFTADQRSLVDGNTGAVQLQSQKESTMNVPVTLKGRELLGMMDKLRDLSQVDYSFNGKMLLDVAGKNLEIPYNLQ